MTTEPKRQRIDHLEHVLSDPACGTFYSARFVRLLRRELAALKRGEDVPECERGRPSREVNP